MTDADMRLTLCLLLGSIGSAMIGMQMGWQIGLGVSFLFAGLMGMIA